MIIQLDNETVWITLKDNSQSLVIDGAAQQIQIDGQNISIDELIFALRFWRRQKGIITSASK